ncbi:MAG: hypothetical protein ACE5LU_19660 [Anaerolineae bacterium]
MAGVAPADAVPSTNWLRAIWAWVTLPGLLVADRKLISALTVSRTSPARLSRHLNGVTWITGLAIVAGLALIGHGRWNGETAIAVGAVFTSNGYTRLQCGLGDAKVALGLALALYVVGLAGALGVPVPAAGFTYVLVLVHLFWNVIQPAEDEDQGAQTMGDPTWR